MNRNLPTFNEAEARNKLSHFTVQGFDLHGIVQAGAGDGEEMMSALAMGVEHYIAFEPLHSAFLALMRHDVPPTYIRVKEGLHNKSKSAILKVADGDGKGSSMMDVVLDHPEVIKNWNQGQATIVGEQKIHLERFCDWFDSMADLFPDEFKIENYDTLQLDTQGNEMEILEGMGDYLQNFKYLCIELSITPVYKGETPGHKVAEWLDERGFILDSPIYDHNDSFFVRKDIKAVSEGVYYGRC